MWRVAESLKVLREQINAAYPTRDRASDGSIGDASHATRNSDHNPWVKDAHGIGVVTAIDTDEDLSPTIHSIEAIITAIRKSRDPRVKYIIYERRITKKGTHLQEWEPYYGKNPHDHHAHISVYPDPKLYDDRRPWSIGVAAEEPVKLEVPAAAPAPVAHAQAAASSELETQLPDPPPAQQQNAENITNIQAGDKNVPDNFVPEDKELDAPPKEGTTAKSAGVTIGGFAVPAFLVAAFTALKSAVVNGYIDARELANAVIGFITSNQKFVFIGVALVVVGLMLKKLYKQITLWLSMYIAARADMHNVTVKPQ